ncbi:addiction module antidote protein, HigA family (plasmid) [Leptospira mayottensis]|uniref:Putative transcriptional regulator n=1 Tax=Leptospira mayottensis 200901116 TaxID=1192864 RepID=A0A343US53_9LEPT|nr:HigA family addiction module antitoxin [Leptospira mayottensis]AVH81626.1 putative transcriptional regulator [Leptospira mayottensis 200901116]AXR62861.1 addiction module antidote protein, HigA family [Leptospira mayottensis]TGN00385.1 addiction module antidote protein, HigA family [Leptospira mayottensis]
MGKNYNPHPGMILKNYLDEIGISQYRLAIETGIPRSNLSSLVLGRRSVTPEIAMRLGKFFGQTAKFWLNLQATYDLFEVQLSRGREINKIKTYKEVV